jgi:WD40 repeat protein
MKKLVRRLAAATALLWLGITASAQVPKALLHSIAGPPEGVQSGAQLGHSVAVDGGLTVVGASLDSTGGRMTGVVKVFDSETGALLHMLVNPDPIFDSGFGGSVAIAGTRVVVGAMSHDVPGAGNAGRAYVYDLAGPAPTLPIVTLNNPDPMSSEEFGTSVAISGSRVVVGAPHNRIPGVGNGIQVGSAYVFDLSSAAPEMPVLTLDNPTPVHIDYFGWSVAISGNTVAVGDPQDDLFGAGNAGTVFLYDLSSATPTVPVTTLNHPSPHGGDEFGIAMAMDGTRLVVGVHRDDDGADASGSVYVYDLSSSTPRVATAILLNPSPHLNDSFGDAVAISGTRVAVGVQFDDTTGTNSGRAYVYDVAGATPTVPIITLNNPTPATSDFLGKAIAISGTRVVVGAYGDDTGALDAGSAYGYNIAGATPTIPIATLNHPGPGTEDRFGLSVAVSGKRMAVGAPFSDIGATNAGSVHVYDLASATPKAIAFTLRNPHPGVDDFFGNNVALVGTRLAVSAHYDDAGAVNSGRVYIYELAGATPTVPIAILNNPTPVVDGHFGQAIAMVGATLVVTAEYDTEGAGKAHIYDLTDAMPGVPVTTLHNPNPGRKNSYGYSVAFDGRRIVVGAPRDGTHSGSVFLYDLESATRTLPVATLPNPNPPAVEGFGFGWSVGVSGTRVVIGDASDDTGAPDTGIAYFYDYASPTPTVPTATLLNPVPVDGANFGIAVGISGVHAVIGVSEDDTGANGTGRAYIYDVTSATPHLPVAALNNPEAAPGDQFGMKVAIEGSIAVISAWLDDTPQFNGGSVYVYGPADADGDGLLDAWEIAHFGTTVGHSALDDFDGDGHRELLELAFGGDPKVPDATPPAVLTTEDGYLTLTITKRPGVAYTVQSAGSPESAAFSAATTTIQLNDDTTLKVRDNVPIGTPPSRFLRVQVTSAP